MKTISPEKCHIAVRTALLFVGFLFLVAPAHAQKVRAPVHITDKTLEIPVAPDRCLPTKSTNRLEELAQYYQRGEWKLLQSEVDCILGQLDDPTKSATYFLPAVHYYSVAFLAKGSGQDWQAFRILIHRDTP